MKYIIMNKEMSGLILNNKKTETRRVVGEVEVDIFKCPKYKVGEELWLREPIKIIKINNDKMTIEYKSDKEIRELEIPERFLSKERPKWLKEGKSIPNGCSKEMSRAILRITKVKSENLQDIDDMGIQAEGIRAPIPNMWSENTRKEYRKREWIKLWNKVSKNGFKWGDNPMVFVYKFKVLKKEK